MAGKHPKKRSAVPDGEPATASRAPATDVSPAELRAQMAILAEQVRRLGDRVERADDAWSAPPTEPAVNEDPSPSESPAVKPVAPSQPLSVPPASAGDDAPPAPAHVVSVPLAHVRPPAAADPGPAPADDDASLPAAAPAAAEHDEQPIAERTGRLIANVIAMAERAAEQIVESAEREAAAIRAGTTAEHAPADRRTADRRAPARSEPDVASPQGELDGLERQREALEALASETDRIESAIQRLREQVRVLDAERRRLYEAIAAGRTSQRG
jgi:hypothetical protein